VIKIKNRLLHLRVWRPSWQPQKNVRS